MTKINIYAFWDTKDCPQKPISFWSKFYYIQVNLLMPYFMLDFLENEEDNRNLKKVQVLVQHFSEQYRH